MQDMLKKFKKLCKYYIDGGVSTVSFCDEICNEYIKEGEFRPLLKKGILAFYDDISVKSSRYSEFEEDHINLPGVYYTGADVLDSVKAFLEAIDRQK